jgi:O-antigen/teichoic acid export membrane protein
MSDPEPTDVLSLKDSARRSLPYAVLSGAFRIVLSLTGMLLLVRYLPPNLYGKWAVMIGFGAPIILFSSLGFLHSLMRFTPALEDAEGRSRFLWSVLFRRLAVALVICIATFLAFPLFAERLGLAEQSEVLSWLIPGFFLLTASQYLVVGLNAGFHQREVFYGSVLQQSGILITVLLGIQWKADLVYFAAAQFVANAIYTLFNLTVAIRYLGGPRWVDLKTKHHEGSEETHYRRSSFVDDLGNSFISPDMSRFILAAFSTSPQVAIYAVATNIVQRLRALMPLEVFRPLATVVFFKRFEETSTIAEINRMFHLLFTVNRIVTVAYLALFIPIGHEALVWVFRADYGDSYLPALALLISMGVFGMPIGLVAQTLRRPQWLVYSKIAVLLNLGLGIPLTIEYGALGMACATALSELSKNLIVYGLLRREFEIRYPWGASIRIFMAATVVALLLLFLKQHINFIVAGGLGGVAWLVSIRVFQVLSNDQRQLLRGVTPPRFQKALGLLVGA